MRMDGRPERVRRGRGRRWEYGRAQCFVLADNTVALVRERRQIRNFTDSHAISHERKTGAQERVHAADVDGDGDIDVLSASYDDHTIRVVRKRRQ